MQRREFIIGFCAATAGAAYQCSQSYAQTNGGVTHRTVDANGIRLHFAEQGEGPLVVLCHGFPESWYSWRHQLAALATAGFHAVAPDMRGYGQSDRPAAIDQYTLLHHVGDMVGMLDALGAEQAVIAGHDWGAPVAWHAALLRPDRFRAVMALSVPYRPRSPVVPTSVMPQREDAVFYQLYFQKPGVAEAELERDVRQTFLKVLGGGPRERPVSGPVGMVPRGGGFLSDRPAPASLPSWLTEADIDFYVHEFERTGFRGGLNWYRNIDRNWELLAPFAGAKVTVPALYMAPTLPAEPGARGFQKGHAKMGGRQKGSRNRFGGDLREAVVAGIQAVGFIEKDKKGRPKPTGRGGVQGFIEWLAMNEPKTAAAELGKDEYPRSWF